MKKPKSRIIAMRRDKKKHSAGYSIASVHVKNYKQLVPKEVFVKVERFNKGQEWSAKNLQVKNYRQLVPNDLFVKLTRFDKGEELSAKDLQVKSCKEFVPKELFIALFRCDKDEELRHEYRSATGEFLIDD